MTATTWDFDLSHSSVNFHVRHLMVSKVHGRFQTWSGNLQLDDEDITRSRVEVTIDTASIDTKEDKRDAHLRSADFFDVESFPTWTFSSTDVSRAGTTWTVAGNLTLKDVTQPVSIDFEETGSATDPFGNQRVGFEGELTVNRKDWGLTWNAALETGGVLVSDKVKLDFDLSAIKAA